MPKIELTITAGAQEKKIELPFCEQLFEFCDLTMTDFFDRPWYVFEIMLGKFVQKFYPGIETDLSFTKDEIMKIEDVPVIDYGLIVIDEIHDLPIFKKDALLVSFYDSPFEIDAINKYFVLEFDKDRFISENLQTCSDCGRLIRAVSPGKTELFRLFAGEHVCISCIRKDLLKNGIPAEAKTYDEISKFLLFWNRDEIEKAGYTRRLVNYTVAAQDYSERLVATFIGDYQVLPEKCVYSMVNGDEVPAINFWLKERAK